MQGKQALRSLTACLDHHSPATLQLGKAGWSRHQPASKVAVPADVHEGDAGRRTTLQNSAMRCRFAPEYAGKMNFYLSAVDDLLRHPDDKPSIGIILCKTKNQVIVEYALRDLAKPVGISSYITKLVESLPKELRGSLPSPKQFEAELEKSEGESRGRQIPAPAPVFNLLTTEDKTGYLPSSERPNEQGSAPDLGERAAKGTGS